MAKLLPMKIESEIRKKLFDISVTNGNGSDEYASVNIYNYIKEFDIQSDINDIWKRVGDDLKSKGFSEDRIELLINEVRYEKNPPEA